MLRLLYDLYTPYSRLSEPAEETFQVKPSIRISLLCLSWIVIFQALVGCHDILILGKSPVKWRQHPNMTLAVDWDVKHQFKQTNHAKRLQKWSEISPYFHVVVLLDSSN